MAEGSTVVLFDDADDIVNELVSSLSALGIAPQETKLRDAKFRCLSFEHEGDYSVDKMTKIIKSLAEGVSDLLMRAYHEDEYGTEVFWLYKDRKLHRYQHDQDSQGPNIVNNRTWTGTPKKKTRSGSRIIIANLLAIPTLRALAAFSFN